MKDIDLSKLINTRRNPNRSGEKNPYQVIREDFYEIMRRRELSLKELGFAIYLRGKACRYTNPFKLADKTIFTELGTTRRIVDPIRRSLQLKGVIKYNSGLGTGHWTEYTMIDSVMIHKRDRL